MPPPSTRHLAHPDPYHLHYLPNYYARVPNLKKNRGVKKLLPIRKSKNSLARYLEPPAESSVSNYESFSLDYEDEEQLRSFPKNHRPDYAAIKKKRKKLRDDRPPYVRDHEPVALRDISDDEEVSYFENFY